MFAGMALSVRLLVYAGLSLFIICGPYVYMVVCVVYAYNLTIQAVISKLFRNKKFKFIEFKQILITYLQKLRLLKYGLQKTGVSKSPFTL